MTNELDLFEQPVMTVKQLSEALGVSERTIRDTAKTKGVEGTFHTLKTNGGNQSVKVFTEEQATLIKQEIQGHHNLKTRQIDNVSTDYEMEIMTQKVIAYHMMSLKWFVTGKQVLSGTQTEIFINPSKLTRSVSGIQMI